MGDINITVGNGGNSANVFKATIADKDVNFNNINISNSGYSQNVTLVSEGAKWVGNSVNIISDGTNYLLPWWKKFHIERRHKCHK